MHDHDIERIAAVAEERLTESELAAAEAAIASCERCSRDLEDHRLALTFMGQAPKPAMTELERASLHRAIRQVTAPKPTRWMRLVPAFAAAAALVMVLGVASLLGRGGDVNIETLAPAAMDSTTSATAKSSEDSVPQQESARDFSAAPAPAGFTPDLPALAGQLRSLPDSSTLEEYACDPEALQEATRPPVAVADVMIEGRAALLYVYPRTALVFDAETCDLLQRIPAQ
ncbi:MAG: hypothetical protein GWP04_00310 [Gammaproteobacteria bacterium]|nr:hypothetical protein [Gammaproteobacteria bacterium]